MAYKARMVDALLGELLGELPAVSIVGPRATGKATTAARHASTIVQLDQPAQAAAFRADPDAALRSLAEPVLLDEWQAAPEVLGAVKRAVDRDPRPGRFILTGSVRAEIDTATWPGTGRVVRVRMYPLTVAEQLELTTRPLTDRIADGELLRPASAPLDLRGYVEIALRGGFPEVAPELGERARQRWLDSYVDQLVTRDADTIDEGRDAERLRRYFEAYAVNTAGVVQDKTLYDAARIDRKTALAYERLLTNLLVIDAIPAWTSNRLKRLVLSPKRHLIEPALITGLLRVDVAAVMRDGDLLGRLLDTFVTAQLRAEAEVADTRPRLFHLREEQGRREVDLIAELGGGRVIGFEIKAHSAPDGATGRHLAWLRDQLGDRFVAGVVLHTGPRIYELGDRISAAPISVLWS